MTRTDIINFMISTHGYKRYLEIGVRNRQDNFDKVKCAHKEDVDPAPKGKCQWKMTSDVFFGKIDQSVKYDLIFVDGMHLFENALKDVEHSLQHLNKNGAILLHDCNPPNRYAQRSYASYKRTKGKWNGTVWLAYVTLRKERVDLFMYVIDADQGIGVIRPGRQVLLDAPDVPFSFDIFAARRREMLNLVSVDIFKTMERSWPHG